MARVFHADTKDSTKLNLKKLAGPARNRLQR
jgi:hypothetical protein